MIEGLDDFEALVTEIKWLPEWDSDLINRLWDMGDFENEKIVKFICDTSKKNGGWDLTRLAKEAEKRLNKKEEQEYD